MLRRFLTLLALSITAATALADWPQWRGPHGNGIADEKDAPLKWSAKENVRWKVPLPGPGNSSPIVWKERVFLTQSLDRKGHQRALLCFDRQNGKKLWEQVVAYPEDEPTHGTNPHCAGTPATDGQRVVACFGSAGLHCWDLDGKKLWEHDLGKLQHVWGNSISPIIHENLVIVWCSPGERQFLLAVDRDKGTEVWKKEVPGGKFGKTSKDWLGSWCTPAIGKSGGRTILVIGVPDEVRAYDPATGAEIWTCKGAGPLMYTSPVITPEGTVVAFCGYGGPALAVKGGGTGDVTKTHRLWVSGRGSPQRIGSAVVIGPHAFLISAPGLAQCFEIATGKDLWDKQRMGGQTWSSLVKVGKRLYVGNDEGDVFVIAADPKQLEILARNEMGKGETIRSSLAVSGADIFIRTYKHLWCIGKGK